MTVADRQAGPLEIAIRSFGAKLRKLSLREETIGHGPTKEKWEAWNLRIQPIPQEPKSS